jgi:hypothetical protein
MLKQVVPIDPLGFKGLIVVSQNHTKQIICGQNAVFLMLQQIV